MCFMKLHTCSNISVCSDSRCIICKTQECCEGQMCHLLKRTDTKSDRWTDDRQMTDPYLSASLVQFQLSSYY